MRDYIILNGVNSNTITGLLISNLPPITKPKIRTQTEEIDGRDGDIVTKLGYSAYDKELEIGLYGDFDIDDVIAYFNSEGTVTFSNEPDKFYNYQILDQIDYEKLIRFKKAKVRMHVQPFKYPLEETPVEITIQTVSGEGEEIDLDNTEETPMTIALKGNTSQDGTPTPDTPVDVHVVSGNNMVKVVGINLFDTGETTDYYPNSRIIDTNNNTLSIKIFASGETRAYNTNQNFKGNTTYTISGKSSTGYARYMLRLRKPDDSGWLTGNDVTISGWNYLAYYGGWWKQFTTTDMDITVSIPNCLYWNIGFGWSDTASTIGTTQTISNIQLETGSQATDYQEHKEASYPITLPEGMFMSWIGDYQDNIYKDSGNWYIEKKIGKVVLNGSENWNKTSLLYATIFSPTALAGTIGTVFSSHFFYKMNAASNNSIFVPGTQGTGNSVVWINTNIVSTANDFKTWLSNNNVTIYYVLAIPTTTEITDTTLKEQLEALANATSYDTTTHITQTNDNKPFILNTTALQKGEATVNNEGNIYSKPTLDIEGSGTVGIYLDGNQMFSVDLSNASECVIDTAQLEAYNPSTNALMNRQVTGDYSNFKLNAGDNQVQATGDITKVTISNYTRWL